MVSTLKTKAMMIRENKLVVVGRTLKMRTKETGLDYFSFLIQEVLLQGLLRLNHEFGEYLLSIVATLKTSSPSEKRDPWRPMATLTATFTP